MLGAFRLLLAASVVWGHMGGAIAGTFSPAISAVICFFMVSGYAVTGLIGAAYPRVPEDVTPFYLDRLLRLAPQYYFYLLVGFVVWSLGFRAPCCQTRSPNIVSIIANLTAVPLDFWMFDKSIDGFQLNMPAWSIGLELQFYLALPWLLASKRALWAVAAIGALIWTLATNEIIDPDYYGYRLLPGTIIYFIVGIAVAQRDRWLIGASATFFSGSALWLIYSGKIDAAFNVHLLFGVLVGFAALIVLTPLRRNKVDEILGNASYGCYLSHYSFVTMFKGLVGQTWAMNAVVAASIGCGFVSFYLLERPVTEWRRSRRKLIKLPYHAAPKSSA